MLKQALIRASLFFLKFRPRSEAEIRVYLAKKGASPVQVNEVVGKLKRLKFIDDEEFIGFWLRRREVRPRASRVIKMELTRLGVDKELVDKVLGDQKQADKQRASQLVKKLKGKDREKMMGYLARRGFDWETIKRVIDAEE